VQVVGICRKIVCDDPVVPDCNAAQPAGVVGPADSRHAEAALNPVVTVSAKPRLGGSTALKLFLPG